MDIRSRLGGAFLATGRIAEALRQYEGVLGAPRQSRRGTPRGAKTSSDPAV
uniref:hypothetical protein n=1 Tax=Streptomyces polyasparticus TaxID=2767826 RepID=UPI001BE493C8|nr:hypothetical protein [Streptomyces polyasparticus]